MLIPVKSVTDSIASAAALASGYIGLQSANIAVTSRPNLSPSAIKYPAIPATIPCLTGSIPALFSRARPWVDELTPYSESSLSSIFSLATPSITMSWSNPPFVNHSNTVFANNTSRSGPNLTSAVKTPTSSPWYTLTGCFGTS